LERRHSCLRFTGLASLAFPGGKWRPKSRQNLSTFRSAAPEAGQARRLRYFVGHRGAKPFFLKKPFINGLPAAKLA